MKTPLSRWALPRAMILPALWAVGTAAQSASPATGAVPQEQFTCRLAGTSDHREIGIYRPGAPQRCRVDYTRDGNTRSLWSSGHDYRFCVSKALEIVRLLEGVNFTCALHTGATGSPTR
jgi:hypothetical protein